jgi:Tol biopolymer transport system component
MLAPGPEPTSEIQRLGGRFLAEGSSPSWSPRGSSIVYCHGDELKILDIGHGSARRLVPTGRAAEWSPGNGRYIAYVRGREGQEEICICEAAGGLPQRLTAGKDPRWSADGQTVYYHATEKRHEYAIGVDRKNPAVPVGAPSGDLRRDAEIVSEDGIRVARQVGDRLQIVARKTGKVVREWPVAKTEGELPVWSPDGRYLAFAGFRCAQGVILGVLDVEQNLLLRVGGSQCGCPRWSPNGSQLAVVVRRQAGTAQRSAEIWSVAMSALERSQPLAPACACPDVPQAAVDLTGPWHRPRGNLVAIDLSPYYTNAKIGHSIDNSLELAAGTKALAGVRFQIGSRMIQLQGQHVPQMPPSVTGIPVHRRVVKLYILHATEDGAKVHGVLDGQLIAEYRVRYADGELATIPVIIGQDVRDWWSTDQEHVSRGQIAWAGNNKPALAAHSYVRLYLSTWENPYPEKTLQSIDYVSMKTIAAPFCVAMTAEEPRSLDRRRQATDQPAALDRPPPAGH